VNRAIHAEWTKLRTVSSTVWSILSVVAGTVLVGAFATLGLTTEEDADVPRIFLSGVYLGQVAVVALGVLAVAPEYDTAMIRTTLAADPRRGRVLAAKAAVVTGLALGGGLAAVLGSLLVGRIILPGRGIPLPSLVDGPELRAAGGTVLYCGLVALLSVGTALALRHTGGAMTVVLSALYTFPILATVVTDPEWRKWILRVAPMTAGLAIQATKNLAAQPIAPWAGLGVLAGYAGLSVVLGAALFRCRDA
jgi:ABC-2 type transport system permease protein